MYNYSGCVCMFLCCRVAKLVSYFLYIIHIYTCVFYKVSEAEGFGINEWVYDGNGSRYVLASTCIHSTAYGVMRAEEILRKTPCYGPWFSAKM